MDEEHEKILQIVSEALGEASVLFMSQNCKGTKIIVPTEELSRIAERTVENLITNT